MNLENWGGDWLYRLDGISKQGFFFENFHHEPRNFGAGNDFRQFDEASHIWVVATQIFIIFTTTWGNGPI